MNAKYQFFWNLSEKQLLDELFMYVVNIESIKDIDKISLVQNENVLPQIPLINYTGGHLYFNTKINPGDKKIAKLEKYKNDYADEWLLYNKNNPDD